MQVHLGAACQVCVIAHVLLQAMAKERGQSSVEGDVFKWLGHAHNKMGDTKRAEEMFTEGGSITGRAVFCCGAVVLLLAL
eukprot:scaffold258652_cov13-Tisochrysis_lutea.AAC.1